MREFRLQRRQVLGRPLEEVFAFFSDPHNLARITPDFLGFEVLSSSTPSIRAGTLIDYRIRLRGIPLRWRSLISAWSPPDRFVDEQVVGPYRRWVHEHRFVPVEGKTAVEDDVRYAVLGGACIDRLVVRGDLARIFDYRARAMARLFGEAAATPDSGAAGRGPSAAIVP